MYKLFTKLTETKNIFINSIFASLILFCAISIIVAILSTIKLF